jgi:mono/diheme cytochrome c family protein
MGKATTSVKGVLVAAAVLILAGCASSGQEDESQLPPDKIFANHCAVCHGGNLEGAIGPNLQKVGGRLSSKEIESIIQNGRGNMPPQQLSDTTRIKLAEWLAAKK